MTRLGVILAVALTVMTILVGVSPLQAGSAGLFIRDPVPDELRERVADMELARRFPETPSTPSPSPTFEEFRRWLDLDP